MLLSLNWLKKYVPLAEDLSMDQLCHDLTMTTVEVEGYEDLRKRYDNVVAAEVISVASHPNADKLQVAQVDIGSDKIQIVCGGSNLKKGQKVVCALPGSRVLWHGEGDPVTIEASELRGVSSFGMICGASEVGLHDIFSMQKEDEIIDFSLIDLDPKPGTPLSELFFMDDFLLEIDNKSLTNRPDLWGHYGIARELAAIYKLPLKKFEDYPFEGNLPKYPVEIKTDQCNRFLACAIDHVDTRKAPLWMQMDLIKVGMRPINVLVDITNYVMLTTGQPSHAYDYDHIDEKIVIRSAHKGETLELLDGKVLDLDETRTVICDAKKVLGLGGVMGGKMDSISPNTKSVVFELANFDGANIRKTAQDYGLRTEASMRFEKSIDSQRVDLGFHLAMHLFHEYFPEAKVTAFYDLYPRMTNCQKVELSLSWLEKRLGLSLDVKRIEELLKPLGFQVESKEDQLTFYVPSFRSTGDVSLADDILEEVARMIGYENFKLLPPKVSLNKAVSQKKVDLHRRIREYLAFTCGFYEIYSYPWVKDVYIDACNQVDSEKIQLAQPPAPDQKNLRDCLVYGLVEACVNNIRYYDEFSIFEYGQVFTKGDYRPSEEDEILPMQRNQLGGVILGEDPEKLFFQLKGVLEGLNRDLQFEPFEFIHDQKPAWADRKAYLSLKMGDQKIGEMGLLSNRTRARADIKYHHAALFILEIDLLKPFASRSNSFKALPLYPHVKQDLSLLLDEDVSWKDLYETIKDQVESVDFVDEYRGEQIPEGKKSLTLSVELSHPERTLTAEEVSEKMVEIRESLSQYGASLRDF